MVKRARIDKMVGMLTECCQKLLGTDSDSTGWEAKPADILGKLEEFITTSVGLYDDLNGGMSAHVRLGGASWCAGDVSSARNRTDTFEVATKAAQLAVAASTQRESKQRWRESARVLQSKNKNQILTCVVQALHIPSSKAAIRKR